VPTLKEVKLEHNSFSGPIPESWASLKDLRVMRLEFNRLSGAPPAFGGEGEGAGWSAANGPLAPAACPRPAATLS